MPRSQIRLATSDNFTGGLNFRADPFQLEKNESPDLMNVDVDPRGGVSRRKTIQQLNTVAAPGAGIISLFPYSTTTGTNQILIKAGDNSIRYSSGGNFTAAGYSRTADYEAAVTFKDLLYTQDGTNAAVRWNGSVHVALGAPGYSTFSAPTDAVMPIGRFLASHMGMVFVAATFEGGVRHENRIRWSHPNFPERWRSDDYIDIDIGREGDRIIQILPFADRLLIFKKNSIHALYGYSRETFSVQPVTQVAGAAGPHAVVGTEHGVYFFDWPQGVFRYDGRNVEWLFERIYPGLLDGKISSTNASRVALGWGNRRLWASVPWESSTNSRTFVYDPTLGKHGAWVQYDQGFSAFHLWDPAGQTPRFMGGHPTAGWVNLLDQDGNQDNRNGTPTDISSYYLTAWHDLGEYALRKRWKRPEIVVLSDVSSRIRVEVFHDYDPATVHNTFEIETFLENPESLWGSAVWGESEWGRYSGANHNRIAVGGSLGLARAVQLKFTGPVHKWRLNSMSLKYVPRRIRG